MAQYKPSEVRQAKGQTAPQEPNLVPIMNLFLTIIPFMLMFVVISQVSLVALNFSQGKAVEVLVVAAVEKPTSKRWNSHPG
jgi:hypothetical protein